MHVLQLVFFFFSFLFSVGPCLPGRCLLSKQPLQIFFSSFSLACALFIAYYLNSVLKNELPLSLWAFLSKSSSSLVKLTPRNCKMEKYLLIWGALLETN